MAITGALLNGAYNYTKHFSGKAHQRMAQIAMAVLLLNPLISYALSMSHIRAQLRNLILELPPAVIRLLPFLDTLRADVWGTLFMGHLAVIVPLQFLLFEAADRTVPPAVLWAARTMGAGHLRAFRTVFVPCMRGTFIAAIIVGFFASFDEIVLALFMLDDTLATTPLKVYRSISQVVQPHAAVTSALLMVTAGSTWFAYSRVPPAQRIDTHTVREWLVGLPKEVVAFALLTVIGYVVVGTHGELPFVPHAVIAIVCGLFAGTVVGLVRLRGILKRLLFSVNVETVFRGIARAFVLEGVTEDVRLIKAVEAGGFMEMTQDRMQRLAKAMFVEFPKGRYVGTDRHVPSRFYELYPEYMHAQMQDRSRRGDIRFVLYGEEAFVADQTEHPAEARLFISTHAAAGVALYSVPWAEALEVARNAGLETPDLGLFESRVAVFFDPPSNGRERWRVMLDEVEGHRRQQLGTFFHHLADRTKKIVRGSEDTVEFRALDDDERRKLKSYILAEETRT